MVSIYPPGIPTVSGNLITVDQFLNTPPRVQKVIADLTNERFIADRIFAQGPHATGGAVIYDQVLASLLYTDRDVKQIEPGSEFPIVDIGEAAPLVARTVKWGGASEVVYETINRNRLDVVTRKITRIRNTIIRKVDSVALAVLRAAPINTATSSANWRTGSTDIFADTGGVVTQVDALDMGYEIDSAIISPGTKKAMLTNSTLRGQLPRERPAATNPTIAFELEGVAGIRNWYVTNRVTNDEVIFLDGQTAGSISDEEPLYSRVVDRPEREAKLIMAARLVVPYVTDPKSVVRMTGVNGGTP